MKYRFKYIVPFKHYTQSSDTNSYVLINKTLSQSKEWEPSSAKNRQEQDIYDYVLNSLGGAMDYNPSNKDTSAKDKCICSIWKNTTAKKDHCRYVYYIDKKENKRIVIDFEIFNVELFLFWNHVGMICYEIGFCNKTALSDLSLKEICDFQNAFIEFGRKKNKWLFLDQLFEDDYDKSVLISIPPSGEERKRMIKETDQKRLIKLISEETFKEKYINPDMLSCSGVHFPINSNTYYIDEKEVQGQEDKTRLTIYRKLNLGLWINHILLRLQNNKDIQIEYFSYKLAFEDTKIPDKAIVYSYTLINNEDQDKKQSINEICYRMANGYSFGHNVSTNPAEFWEHSADVVWYASRQGCGCTVRNNSCYSSNFETTIESKENDDYFLLYILQLNQLLGLSYYANVITKDLTSDIRAYTNANKLIQNELLNTHAEINLFLMKSSYSGISSIQKQNEFNSYVKKQLDIDENIVSIQSGMAGLNALQESLAQKKREESESRLSISLGFLALLAVISALSDAKVLFWDSDPINAFHNLLLHPFYIASSILIMIIAIYAINSIIRCVRDLGRKDKNK